MPVENREVGGDNDPLCGDGSAGCHRLPLRQREHLCVLEGLGLSGNGGDELERVELGLAWKAHRPRHRKGEGQLRREFRREPQLVQGRQLPVQLPPAVQGVDEGIPLLKAAVDGPAELPVPLQRLLVGL